MTVFSLEEWSCHLLCVKIKSCMSVFNFVLLPLGSDFLFLSLSHIYEVMQQNGCWRTALLSLPLCLMAVMFVFHL